MKIVAQCGLFVWLSFLLGGCCMLECIGQLTPDKPYGTHWSKAGITEEQRREDSRACGATGTPLAADHVIFSKEQLQQEKHPDEKDDFAPRTRLTKSWIACMESKGYNYQH
ncbi:MAG TPA: hypothetical protein VGC12_08665 [Methyloradius sp.]